MAHHNLLGYGIELQARRTSEKLEGKKIRGEK